MYYNPIIVAILLYIHKTKNSSPYSYKVLVARHRRRWLVGRGPDVGVWCGRRFELTTAENHEFIEIHRRLGGLARRCDGISFTPANGNNTIAITANYNGSPRHPSWTTSVPNINSISSERKQRR